NFAIGLQGSDHGSFEHANLHATELVCSQWELVFLALGIQAVWAPVAVEDANSAVRVLLITAVCDLHGLGLADGTVVGAVLERGNCLGAVWVLHVEHLTGVDALPAGAPGDLRRAVALLGGIERGERELCAIDGGHHALVAFGLAESLYRN